MNFKAWDNKNKRWLEDFLIKPNGNLFRVFFSDLTGNVLTSNIQNITICRDTEFLGLFEFDIIRDHNGIGVIKYSKECGCFKVYYVGKMEGKCKYFMDYNIKGEKESIEKIGNTFDTPHLLENK
mgnify:CR=1 FL=1